MGAVDYERNGAGQVDNDRSTNSRNIHFHTASTHSITAIAEFSDFADCVE